MEENGINENQATQSSSSGISFPTVNEPKKSGSTKTILIVGILILVAILGFVIYKTASSANEEVSTEPTSADDLVTPSSEQTVETFTPAPSSSPAAIRTDKAKIEIQIQNGTGIPGEAAYLQTQLSSLGYTNIKVGNSDSTVTATVVTFSDSLDSGVVSEITQKLNSIYQTVTTRTSQSATFDIVVITGLRKGASPKPSGASLSSTPRSSSTPRASGSPSPTPSRSPSPTP